MARDDERVEKRTTRTAPPAAPPPIVSDFNRPERSQWARLAAYLALALIIVGAVVLGGRWLYNNSKDNEPQKPAPTVNDTPKKEPTTTKKKPTQPTRQPSTTATGQDEQASGERARELANTGPGEVAAIFAGTALAAASLHYIVQLRRTS